MTRTKNPPTTVEQIGSLLDEGCAPDEIAVLLRLDEREVRRIAQLLDERGPADPAPDVQVAEVAAAVADLPNDDEPAREPTRHEVKAAAVPRHEVKAAAVLCRRAVSGSDLDDLAGALGIRHAVEPAERWLNARERAAVEPVAPTPTTVLEGVQRAKERLREHVAAYAAPAAGSCRCTIISSRTLHEPDAWEQADDCPVHPLQHRTPSPLVVEFEQPDDDEPDDEQPAHVHEPFPVADEAGVFHAECECGTRWDRAACDVCGLPVAALRIAKTGTPRHAHHDLPRKD